MHTVAGCSAKPALEVDTVAQYSSSFCSSHDFLEFRTSMLEVPIQGHHSTLSTSFQKRWEAWEELLTDDILDLYKVDGG